MASAVLGVFPVGAAMGATSQMRQIDMGFSKLMGQDRVAALARGSRAPQTEAGAVAGLVIAGAAEDGRTRKAKMSAAHGQFIPASRLGGMSARAKILEEVI
jgi:hypothetical protein